MRHLNRAPGGTPAVVLLLLTAAACSGDTSGGALDSPCLANTDCADNICHHGTCAAASPLDNGQPCALNAQCRSFVCASGICAPGSAGVGKICRHKEECASNKCVGGLCKDSGPTPDAGAPRDTGAQADGKASPDKTSIPDLPPWPCKGPTACVSTAAGTTSGNQDGPVATARLKRPVGVAVSAGGKVYIADGNNSVRLLSGGVVTTLAKTHAFGKVADVALNKGGTLLYVADASANQIKVITLSNEKVTVLAGSGSAGQDNGAAAGATFKGPGGVAVDSAGGVYVADTQNHMIRLITGGKVSTLAGSGQVGCQDGAPAAAKFYRPDGVAVDANKNVFVADTYNYLVRKISGGAVSTLAGHCGSIPTSGHVDAAGDKARFWYTYDVDVDPTGAKVYVADRLNHRVRLITNGLASTLAGKGPSGFNGGGLADGPLLQAQFKDPMGIALAGAKVYVTEWNNHRVRLVTP